MTHHSLTSTDSLNVAQAPFSQAFPIKNEQDISRLEQTPFEQALAVKSTYQLFKNSARAFVDSPALTFLVTADPEQPPVRCSYSELFTGITQTANRYCGRRGEVCRNLGPQPAGLPANVAVRVHQGATQGAQSTVCHQSG